MNHHNLTIEKYLSLPNPVISNHDGEKFRNEISGGTTRNPRWVSPRSIHRWKSFNYDLFEELFDSQYGRNLRDILKIEYNFADLSDLRYPFCEVRDEDSLETLLITSIQQTVCKALHVAQSTLLGQEGRGTSQSDMEAQIRQESIYMARGYVSLSKLLVFIVCCLRLVPRALVPECLRKLRWGLLILQCHKGPGCD